MSEQNIIPGPTEWDRGVAPSAPQLYPYLEATLRNSD